jgi:hypothetical protein
MLKAVSSLWRASGMPPGYEAEALIAQETL